MWTKNAHGAYSDVGVTVVVLATNEKATRKYDAVPRGLLGCTGMVLQSGFFVSATFYAINGKPPVPIIVVAAARFTTTSWDQSRNPLVAYCHPLNTFPYWSKSYI